MASTRTVPMVNIIFVAIAILFLTNGVASVNASPILSQLASFVVGGGISSAVANGTDGKLGCFRHTYSRGAGSRPRTCPASSPELSGLLCYPACSPDFKGVGPVCWQRCQSGYSDEGPLCRKPDTYGRGIGYIKASKCEQENPEQGCEKSGLLWYPKCREGFKAYGCCTCAKPCPDGMADMIYECAKRSHGRGVGTLPSCESAEDTDGPLCYDKCSSDYSGAGPVCWLSSCPADFPTPCGPVCAASSDACTEIGTELGKELANIAFSGTAFAGCAAATFANPAAAIACWGRALAGAAKDSSATMQFWTANVCMCPGASGDDGGCGSGGGGSA